MAKRILLPSLCLILSLNLSAFSQGKLDSTGHAKLAATEAKAAAPSEEEQAEAVQKATKIPVSRNRESAFGSIPLVR